MNIEEKKKKKHTLLEILFKSITKGHNYYCSVNSYET